MTSRVKVISLNVGGLRNQVKRRSIFSYLKNSGGVCILQSVNSGFSPSTVHADRDGRYIIVKVSIGDKHLFVIKFYAPNKGAEQDSYLLEV